MEIKIKAYAYTIDIITEIRYFCKCNNAVFGKFRIIFTCAISKTDCSLHHSFHALFKISGNGKFVRTAVLPPHPSHSLRKSTPRPRPAPTLPKPHYPSPRTKLASLVKGRCCRPKEFGRLPEGLPHHYPLAPHQPFQKPHYPSPRTTTLASLVKGRWIDGKPQTVALLHFNCDTSAFLIYQTFRRQDRGIATPLLLKPHYPLICTITLAFRRASVCVCLYGFASALSHLAFRRGVSLLLPKHHCNYKKQFKRNPM